MPQMQERSPGILTARTLGQQGGPSELRSPSGTVLCAHRARFISNTAALNPPGQFPQSGATTQALPTLQCLSISAMSGKCCEVLEEHNSSS